MTAKALSIQQPWAWAITDLDKRIENRSMATRHRGEVFLHASAEAQPLTLLDGICTSAEAALMADECSQGALSLGAIVGVASIVGCLAPPPGTEGRTCEPSQRRWAERASHWWLLHNVVKLPVPVSCKGMLGLWTVPPDVEAEVRRQIEMAKKKLDARTRGRGDAEKPAAPPAADPKSNSREDLGYSQTKGKKPRLKPEEREEVLRLSQLVCEAKRDLAKAIEAKKQASQPAKEAAARLKKYIDQLDAVESGNWQPGMFDNDKAAGDGAGDENE